MKAILVQDIQNILLTLRGDISIEKNNIEKKRLLHLQAAYRLVLRETKTHNVNIVRKRGLQQVSPKSGNDIRETGSAVTEH